ncbi:histone-lysine N-methyltransferase, H3 lysine-9 specific SUVH6 isoform X1 [Arachis duranensis]|uniref:Histone-lysine N-methyltransferase, H3 lysine-9 specific SUVH6 isoform X1 n=1 Tax=Arachis duranensis TaxID=130453 RepID=A0A6P5NJA7_ARADU|nr:histone-lysine N-methyltransferase, H3 lysine-9 specific SUVH6 isoform X1 [Arachis duranensis]XP_015963647.1 histone-lysine N-methyltransferase, H3 lysine-9 specific SUVH6 isoform X1 [Arachis duranensis]XP_020997717.1 histone-lysine N-methyltransferase, H3 lysine-9 specific SUVH6 isoform X1 [Arachis duranensis]XP_020997718.1 histone-lysine N-methyltransferase, H3 lysine-9 specific SUVH6 isoform X1 [Arachis duranensis]XP_020997721.1 histone-lysine N-methyltransferase, H3 lysine-9 specific SUV
MAASVSNGFEKSLRENGDCKFHAPSEYKRRKVSAVRDFPEECGPFAPRIEAVLKCEDNSQHPELHAKTLVQTTDCSLNKENPVVSSDQVDRPPLVNDEPAKMLLADMEALADTESGRAVKLSSPVGEVAGSSAWTENMLTRSYFPRRKVSAIRDFPALCGRNAPSLLNENRGGKQKATVNDDLLKKVAATEMKEAENNAQDDSCKRKLVDIVLADSEGNATENVNKQDGCEPPIGINKQHKNPREMKIELPTEIDHHQAEINSREAENEDAIPVEKTLGMEIIVYPEVRALEAKPLRAVSNRKVVLGLKSGSECFLRSNNGPSKFKGIDGAKESKGKKDDVLVRLGRTKTATRTKDGIHNSRLKPLKKKKENAASHDRGQLEILDKDCVDPNQNGADFQTVTKPCSFNVNVPPFGHSKLSDNENDSNVTRHKVRETLRLFQAVSRKLLQELEAKNERGRVDLLAAKVLKEKGKYVNEGKQILGSVPGIEVGDEFQYRIELNIVGLHRQIQGGIDYVKHSGKILATSIVASGGYADDLDNSDVLIYTGQGGNVMNSDKQPEDQKLERGNLALKNSNDEQNPVRVIRGADSADGKSKTYVYDGLYLVESCWQDMGPHGKLVYKFRLRRISGQPELPLKELKKSKKFKMREGLCVNDISYGKERIPVCAVNVRDDEKPPPFKYITSMIYPDCDLIPAEGCGCINGCSELRCSCVAKNGGEIPYNHNGAIVEAKPLVFECGPSCKCPPTCYNRVSQHGIKFQLEIFKTSTRGWGVRSLNSIPSGSFICEYIGELLEDKEAEQRTGNDEYLFDIGNNYTNNTLWDGLSNLMPDAQSSSGGVLMDGCGFTIDAAQYGNVGRFINHSCSPNLYAQNVLYDHHDKRMPHIMFFAAENIPPLQELAYDYNYMIDQVHDSDGNIKRKDCYCGSVQCTGRMY